MLVLTFYSLINVVVPFHAYLFSTFFPLVFHLFSTGEERTTIPPVEERTTIPPVEESTSVAMLVNFSHFITIHCFSLCSLTLYQRTTIPPVEERTTIPPPEERTSVALLVNFSHFITIHCFSLCSLTLSLFSLGGSTVQHSALTQHTPSL
jgi:hypothetical protein